MAFFQFWLVSLCQLLAIDKQVYDALDKLYDLGLQIRVIQSTVVAVSLHQATRLSPGREAQSLITNSCCQKGVFIAKRGVILDEVKAVNSEAKQADEAYIVEGNSSHLHGLR